MEQSSAIHHSPDGKYRIEIFPVPMRMSHEVDTLTVYENQDGKVIFDPGSLWDASRVMWSDDSRFATLSMRHYPDGTLSMKLTLDFGEQSGELSADGKTIFSDSFPDLQKTMQQVGNIHSHLPRP